MQQFVITETNLRAMLKKAFKSGFDCPLDMMDGEIANIYNEYITEHGSQNCHCNPTPPKIKPETNLDSPEALKLLLEEIKQKRLF